MKTPAIVSTLTVVGSLAFAAGREGGRLGAQEVPQPEGALASADGNELPQALSTDQCAIGEPLNWFTKAYRLPSCFTQRWSQASLLQRGHVVADIDRDGKDDHLLPMHFRDDGNGCVPTHTDQWQWGGGVVNCALGSEYPFLWKPVTSNVGGTVTLTLQPALTLQSVTHALVFGDLEDGTYDYSYSVNSLKLMDLFDVDADGDLDLIIHMAIYAYPNEAQPPVPEQWNGLFWFENNAVTNPPVAADLNQDGNVDGIDLGLLLASWGS